MNLARSKWLSSWTIPPAVRRKDLKRLSILIAAAVIACEGPRENAGEKADFESGAVNSEDPGHTTMPPSTSRKRSGA